MTTLSNLGLHGHYSHSRDDSGMDWIWAPTAEPDPACEALCSAGKLERDAVVDGYMTYRVCLSMAEHQRSE